MVERASYPEGVPSWVDLTSTDPEGARAFYAALFEWELDVNPAPEAAGYTTLRLGGRRVGGMSGWVLPEPPPAWVTYLAVDDIDKSVARVTEHGGEVHLAPMTVGGGGVVAGRVAVLRDPAGAFFGFWEAGLNTGAEEVNAPGTLVWNELHTPDLPEARAFYAGVVGVDFQSYDDGSGGPEYAVFSAGDHMAGGMTVSDAVPPHWRVYFGTADTDATVARAVELGGTVADPAVDTPQGRMANLLDPHGGAFSVISVAPEE